MISRDNVPAGGTGFKWDGRVPDAVRRYCAAPQSRDPDFDCVAMGPAQQRTACALRSVRGTRLFYAMNMRTAEAIVSNAPKPMKIFPIREV